MLPYLQLNSPAFCAWIILDIDRRGAAEAWLDAGLPPPTYVAVNPANGHAQLGYALSAPVCKTDAARQKPLQYLAAIEYAYTAKCRADFGFVGPLSKNPLHDMWEVWEPANAPAYELHYLAEFVDLPKRLPLRMAGVGRNCDLFEKLRRWAYVAVRGFWGPGRGEQFEKAVLHQAEAFNVFEVPLAFSEVKGIARSVSRYVWRNTTPTGFRKVQAERGRRGGTISGEVRRAESAPKRAKASELHSRGLSLREIAELLEVDKSTVSRWLTAQAK